MTKLSYRLIKFNQHLLPGMVHLKYKAMAQSPFRFFRGTCHLFYEDLSKSKQKWPSPVGWICGDLHLENFGSFKGDNRMVYFDMNDFDESALAPLSWELLRMCTSILIAFNDLGIKGADASLELFLTTYARMLAKGKAMYIDPRTAHGAIKDFLKTVKKRKESELIDQVRDKKAKHLRIKTDQVKHLDIGSKLKHALMHHLTSWVKNCKSWPENYKVKDVVFRVAGTGSIGLSRYMFLLQSKITKNDYALLDMKQCFSSSLAPYDPAPQPEWASEAERIVEIKFRMQNVSPALLNTTVFQGDTYVIQEMQPMADKFDLGKLTGDPKAAGQLIRDMALIVASAQLRSGGFRGSAITDELITFGRDDSWQKPIIRYARKYAKQVVKDYKQFNTDFNNGVLDPGTQVRS